MSVKWTEEITHLLHSSYFFVFFFLWLKRWQIANCALNTQRHKPLVFKAIMLTSTFNIYILFVYLLEILATL